MSNLATITSVDKLRSFFSFPNELRLWRHNSITIIKLSFDSNSMIDITCDSNDVYTIYTKGMDVTSCEETICKLCKLILNIFPLHFQYESSKDSYKLL